ncbi:MAG TPA: DUF4062 domain-containing protein [Capsulimonadaceae bacterium]|nr:DUF4062 domain-containing protein [Capsulimonadaceae bacterium]
MKVFISSVISGYETYRDAASTAAKTLGHSVIRAEDFPATPSAPQLVCLKGVRDADVMLLLMGGRYGYIAPSGLSATHEEYHEARDTKPVLVFVERGTTRELQQEAFLQEVSSWKGGQYTAEFSDSSELQAAVIKALHEYELSQSTGTADEAEMLKRAQSLIPASRNANASTLFLAMAGGPRKQILRPSEIEDRGLASDITKEALFGSDSIFDTTLGSVPRTDGHSLIVEQNNAIIRVDELGSIYLAVPASRRSRNDPFAGMLLIEEDVREKLKLLLRFSSWLMERIDPIHRLSEVVVLAGLIGAGYMGWQTEAQVTKSNGTFRMGKGGEAIVINLAPMTRKRAAIALDSSRIIDDLVVLLRREIL